MVGWLVVDDRDGARVTHRLSMRGARIADADDADVRIAGMTGACEIRRGPDGFALSAEGGATLQLNGTVVQDAMLADNDVLEVHGARLVFKCSV